MAHLLDAMGIPIDPDRPNEFRKAQMVANLLDEPAVMFVTSSHFGRLVEAWSASDEFVFAPGVEKPTPQNCKRFQMGMLTVVNAFTEDQQAVNTANRLIVPESFLARKRALISGRGRPKVQDVEAI
jgi:hypothetical protein